MIKKILSSLVLTLLLGAVVEGVAWLALLLAQDTAPAGVGGVSATSGTPPGKKPATADVQPNPFHEVLHPFLGFVHDPSWEDAPWAGIGPQGFFGREDHARAAGPRTFTVAVFGGSVANHFAFLGRETLLKELRHLPGLGGREMRVQSFAMGGYKQPQQLFALAYLLSLGEKPDLVINLDGFNEVALGMENVQRGIFPFYPRDWSGRVAGVPDLAASRLAGEIAFYEERRERRAALCTGALRWSGLCRVVRRSLVAAADRRLAALREELASRPPSSRAFLETGPSFEPPAPAAGEGADDALLRALAEDWGRCSVLMHQLASAAGIPYYHFLQPNQYVPGSKPMGSSERRQAFKEDHPYRTAVVEGYPHLVEAGKELTRRGVRFHDLRFLFRNHSEPLYVDTCCHLSPRGNEILAHAVAEILAEDWRPTGPPGVTPLR